MSASIQDTAAQGRERDLFLHALEIEEASERAAFLSRVCGRDNALRNRLEGLLRENAKIGNFLEASAVKRPSSAPVRTGPGGTEMVAVTERPGDRIGRYKLLQEIGEGGCGVVYMAEQEEPVTRRVALKIIKLGMDTRQVIARFEAERQALALMQHPNIAQVLDAGATDTGRPYFVMELVRGVRITDYCDQNSLPTEERLKLFIQVCQAIQHAHQKGIIHRDIKPSNVMVTLHDGTPVPKVIDFGVAKATGQQRLTEKTLFTAFEQFIGTPAYMSPEQAEMSGMDIDTRSDVYSLGVLLYELLTGQTPFDAEMLLKGGLDECRRTIRLEEPARPSNRVAGMGEAEMTTTANRRRVEGPKLIHQLAGDLDWVVMKCLEKDRTRRYATTNALAADVEHFLNGEPVNARPPSSIYRFRKLVSRNRGAFLAAGIVVLTLVTGVGVSTWLTIRAKAAEREARDAQDRQVKLRERAEYEREQANQQRALANLNEYVADINLAQEALKDGNYGRAVQLLQKHVPKAGEQDLRGFEWRYLWQLAKGDEHISLPPQDGPVESIAFSPAGDLVAAATRESLNVYDVRSGSLVATLPGGGTVSFSGDGKLLYGLVPGALKVWNVSDWTLTRTLHHEGIAAKVSSTGQWFAAWGREGLYLYDASNGRELALWQHAYGPAAFSPDNSQIAITGEEGLTVRSVPTGRELFTLEGSTNVSRFGPGFSRDSTVAYSPDGRLIVAARNARSEKGTFILGIWDAKSGRDLGVMPESADQIEHTSDISALIFSRNGLLATASRDHSIRLWDPESRRRVATLQGHLNEVWTLAFSTDGQMLASGARDGGFKLWFPGRKKTEDILAGSWQPLGFSRDGRVLAAVNAERLSFIDATSKEVLQEFALERTHFRGPTPLSITANLSQVAQGLSDGRVKFLNTQTKEENFLTVADQPVTVAALSPNGDDMLTAGFAQPTRLWDLRQGTNTVLPTQARYAFFSPNSKWLATFEDRDEGLVLWDVATRTERRRVENGLPFGAGAAFSPDSRLLAVSGGFGDVENSIKLWELETGKLVGSFAGHKQPVFSLAFSPDGKTLASAGDDSTLRLWNVANRQELLTIRRLGGALAGLTFSPDGRVLAGLSGFFTQQPELRFHRAPF